jgi:hypothetical protein
VNALKLEPALNRRPPLPVNWGSTLFASRSDDGFDSGRPRAGCRRLLGLTATTTATERER